MRNILTFGALSLAMAAGIAACGDDDGGDSPSNGGTAGRAGAAGNGGTAGGGAGGAPGGAGGTAGTGGAGGAAPLPAIPDATCEGCVQLTVSNNSATPPAGATQNQAGYIFIAAPTAAPFDLSQVETITWRIQVLTPDAAFFVQPFIQSAPPEDPNYAFGFFPTAVTTLPATAFPAGEWRDVVLDVGAIGAVVGLDAGADGGDASTGEPPAPAVDAGDAGPVVLTAFDKAFTRQIGLNVGAQPAAPRGWVSIQVDSVTVEGTSNFTTKTFDTGVDTLQLNNYQVPTGTLPPAAN